jgi:hypothetical protein
MLARRTHLAAPHNAQTTATAAPLPQLPAGGTLAAAAACHLLSTQQHAGCPTAPGSPALSCLTGFDHLDRLWRRLLWPLQLQRLRKLSGQLCGPCQHARQHLQGQGNARAVAPSMSCKASNKYPPLHMPYGAIILAHARTHALG